MFIAPTTMNMPSTSSFTTTMMLFARTLSRTPRYSSHVISSTITAAGTFSSTGSPRNRGAVCSSPCTSGLELSSAVR
jgi:hypothetical protein